MPFGLAMTGIQVSGYTMRDTTFPGEAVSSAGQAPFVSE